MLTRYLALFSIIHGALFVSAGSIIVDVPILKPIPAEVHGEHHQHQAEEAHDHGRSITCVLCMDGVCAVGEPSTWQRLPVYRFAIRALSQLRKSKAAAAVYYYSRAPPQHSLLT
ncbi:MAG: hypothetical protein P8J55_14830 [Pseudomonadales bacterium]|nr:hypothetical protein [Pseudomonadales bacterium]